MMTNEEKRLRGLEAKQVLDNRIFQESFVALRTNWTAQLLEAGVNDIERIAEIHKTIKVLDFVHQFLVDELNTGKLAEETLKWQHDEKMRVEKLLDMHRMKLAV